jgi:hypothetical protein
MSKKFAPPYNGNTEHFLCAQPNCSTLRWVSNLSHGSRTQEVPHAERTLRLFVRAAFIPDNAVEGR